MNSETGGTGSENSDVVLYEVRGSVAVVTMNRPEYRNAQNSVMTYALDAAFVRAVEDDEVKVILLNGNGRHFSAGHDIGTPGRDVDAEYENRAVLWWRPTVRARDGGLPGDVPTVARDPQTDHRSSTRRLHRRRTDAVLGLRHDRCQ
jgi:enoyl-CoA hydratase